ncbi:uncharacterized protein LOC127250932 [Andrographis paniculata]|uniref:uncharacterized protein LOC127250932 n=1 Tax=Andrographis paniculata TaxID=175694 RepID=UPI0021E722BB|nr:uncharacterized protein LOC127250932 [Andrographis paniculata]
MEVAVPCDKSAARQLSISSSVGTSVELRNPIKCSSSDLSMNDLNSCFIKCLSIEDPKNASGKNGVKEHECANIDEISSRNSSSEKCLCKCVTFPLHHGPKSSESVFLGEEEKRDEHISAEVNGFTKPSDQHFPRSKSLPVPSKLASALKGTREKQGLSSPKKLSVSWAPNVYDPIPTSVSHVPSSSSYTNQRHGKKYGKYKKGGGGGKSSRGSKGKDKKYGRKNGGESSKIKALHGVGFGPAQIGSIVEYEVGSPRFSPNPNPNSTCERSFLENSVGKLHFPAAEAT